VTRWRTGSRSSGSSSGRYPASPSSSTSDRPSRRMGRIDWRRRWISS
jgi:hypothetical protein